MWSRTYLVLFALCTGCTSPPPADLVLRGGAVYTVDASAPWAEAVAISGERLTYVGEDAAVADYIGPETEVIELDGKMVLPGFFDSHSHPTAAPVASLSVRLYGLRSLDDYLAAIREFANGYPDREVIRGAGWTNTLFPEQGPSRLDLDTVDSERPIVLESEDGHSTWVNSRALELAGIDRDTEDPEGGIIVRDRRTGEPTGTLRESAMGLTESILPERTLEEHLLALEAFARMAAEAGVTSVRDAYIPLPSDVALAYSRADMPVRVRANLLVEPGVTPDELEELASIRDQYRAGRFAIDGIKIFVDGVVEGETAYLLEPYEHRPEYKGELLWDPTQLDQVVAQADRQGFVVHGHAIGDGAVRVMLDAFRFARAENGVRDARHQVTHVQLVAPSDFARFAELDVVAVPQPFWFTKGPYFDELEMPFLGEARASAEYPMQSFFDHGVTVASASDFPVTIPFKPLQGIEMGVLRSVDPDDPELVLGPSERASLEDMIESFTLSGAYASFVEDRTGSLTVGKLADVVVLERNLFEIDADEVSETEVLMTVFEGAVVFRAEKF